MKLILTICILVLVTCQNVFAQKRVEGYYIDHNNNSIPATFQIPERFPIYANDQSGNRIDFATLKEEVVIFRNSGSTHRLTPRDIKGFVFTYNTEEYKLFSKPVTQYRSNFLRPLYVGEKLKVYHYTKGHHGYPVGFGHKSSSPGWKEYFWTFEKPGGPYLFLNSSMRKKEIVESLKDYFKDDPAFLNLIQQKFRGFMVDKARAIESLVETYNDVYSESLNGG